MALPIILCAAQGNADSTPVQVQGRLLVTLSGTHGGGTSVVQISGNDGVTWIPYAAGSFTADGYVVVDAGFGCMVRVSTTGGAGNSINARAGLIDIQ